MIHMEHFSVKMKICPRLLIFELSDCTLRIFRGYDFSIFLILLFLDRYFEGFDSDLRASPPVCLVMECPLGSAQEAVYVPFKCLYNDHLGVLYLSTLETQMIEHVYSRTGRKSVRAT